MRADARFYGAFRPTPGGPDTHEHVPTHTKFPSMLPGQVCKCRRGLASELIPSRSPPFSPQASGLRWSQICRTAGASMAPRAAVTPALGRPPTTRPPRPPMGSERPFPVGGVSLVQREAAMKTGVVAVLAVVVTAACSTGPSTVPTPQQAVVVYASFDATWDAVIELFSQQNVPIKTIDRSSGLIATDDMVVSGDQARDWADCGSNAGAKVTADHAVYNVLVRGDSTQCTVRVTAAWSAYFKEIWSGQWINRSCVSSHKWESAMQQDAKVLAEQYERQRQEPPDGSH